MNCKNCGDPIAPCVWADGPGWVHKGHQTEPHLARRCRQMYAEPSDAPEPRYMETLDADERGDW